MATKLAVITSYEHTSKSRTITVQEALDYMASQLPEDTELVDEEGETDFSTLAAIAICKAALRAMALDKDNGRKAAGIAPTHVYRAALGDVSKEAQAALDVARVEAAKLAGIELAPAPVKVKAAKVEPLEAAMAATLAAPATKPAKAPKAPKAKPAKVETPKAAPLPVEPKIEAPKAKPVEPKIEAPKSSPPVTAIAAASGLDMAALRAKHEARKAAKKAAKAS